MTQQKDEMKKHVKDQKIQVNKVMNLVEVSTFPFSKFNTNANLWKK